MTTTDRLKATMARYHWTQFELADYLGVTRSALANWLNGVRNPPSHVVRVLDILSTIEWAAPAIHATFLPVKRTTKQNQKKKIRR